MLDSGPNPVVETECSTALVQLRQKIAVPAVPVRLRFHNKMKKILQRTNYQCSEDSAVSFYINS
jgi:hypothetical protein